MIRIFITEKQLQHLIAINMQFELAKIGFERKGYAIAQHAVDSTDDSETWKDYWEENHPSHHFPSEPHICPSCLLTRNKFVGGHIISDGETYIIPVCKKCNDSYKNSKANDHFFYVRQEDMIRVPED